MRRGRFWKRDGFHPFGCSINISKNIIKIITVLQWAHQINMEVRKTQLGDGDGLGDQACVAVDLAHWQDRHPRAQAVTSLERWHQKNLDEIIWQEASLPGWATLWKWSKMIFLNLRGTIGWKLPVETSLARRWVPVWRKANLRDVQPSKCCVSGQRFCSAAISSKSTGSDTNMAATDPVAVWFGQDKKLAMTFFNRVNKIFTH
jgi:hypothetical protein